MNDAPDRSPDTGPSWLTAQDAATVLGVHERTVRRAIKRVDLPASKHAGTWHIRPGDLDLLRFPRVARPTLGPAPTPSLILLPQVPMRPPFVVPRARLPLVGRERELTAKRKLLLDERAPLVTLTGPGGSGKTRLSLAIAGDLRDQLADGIWFVDLSALRDPDLVPDAVAQVLDIRKTAGATPFNRLKSYLQPRTTLLVLDNVEQVVAAGPLIAQLLVECPGVQVLATSRIPLHVTMEHQFHVTPLDLPRLEP